MSNYMSYGSFGKKEEPIQGNVIEIESREHKDSLLRESGQTGRLMIVDIWGSFCGPCKESRPAYEALSLKYPSVLFCAEDVQLEITPEATVVPWFQFFGRGYFLEETRGADIAGIEETILKYLQNRPVAPPTGQKTNPQFTQGAPPKGNTRGPGTGPRPQGGPAPGQYSGQDQYSQGPPTGGGRGKGTPNMGRMDQNPLDIRRAGGNPPINRNAPAPQNYDMQRPTRPPHGVRR